MGFSAAAPRPLRTITRIALRAYARIRRLILRWRGVIAEVRIHRARLEAELYRNRYRLRTKNDDDLPIMP